MAKGIAVWAALFGNLLIAIAKLAGGIVSGSASMFAEAAHSFSDVGNQLLLLLGLQRSKKAPNPKHPYGTGKAAYFWPLMVAVLLFGVAGGYSLFEGIEKFLHPHEVHDITLSLGVLALAFVIEAVVLIVAIREAIKENPAGMKAFLRENRDASLLTVLVEDSLALIGLPIAAGALILSKATGDGRWDGAGSMIIGLLLMSFALFLGRQVHDLLLGRGLRKSKREALIALIDKTPHMRLRDLRTMHLGPDAVLATVDLECDYPDSDSMMRAIVELERAMKELVPELAFVYLEPNAAVS